MFFKLIKVRLLVSEPYIYQNARCNDKKKFAFSFTHTTFPGFFSKMLLRQFHLRYTHRF